MQMLDTFSPTLNAGLESMYGDRLHGNCSAWFLAGMWGVFVALVCQWDHWTGFTFHTSNKR